MGTSTKDAALEALRSQLSDEIRALPMGPARVSDHARWLQAAWDCTNVALGNRRAQQGSSRAAARAMCARIITGENVPTDELRRVTAPASQREFEKKTARQLDREIADVLYDPKHLKKVSDKIAQEKLAPMQDHYPLGTRVKVVTTQSQYTDKLADVTGYDVGGDEDEPLLLVRFLAPVGPHKVRIAKFHLDEVVRLKRS